MLGTMVLLFCICSGTIGSGLCLFSKWPICETLYHKFDPNGYPHKVQHGDWFGGKGVGMAVIRAHGLLVHVYVTHVCMVFSTPSVLCQTDYGTVHMSCRCVCIPGLKLSLMTFLVYFHHLAVQSIV